MEEQRVGRMRLAMALHGNGGTLLQRVRRLMGEKAMEQKQMSGIRMMTAVLALTALYAAPHVAHSMKIETKAAKAAVAAKAEPMAQTAAAAPEKEIASAAVTAAPRVDDVKPQAASIAAIAVNAMPAPALAPAPRAMEAEASQEVKQGGMQYLDGMRAAGYPLDLNPALDEIVRLRSVGVTPEYASAMAQAGMGKPTLKELVSLRAVGVTPEYAKSLKSSSSAPATFHDVISFKSL